MKPIFADTAYFLALLNKADEWHRVADDFSIRPTGPLITTAWVLTELMDALSKLPSRLSALQFIRDLETNPRVTVIPPTLDLFREGLDLLARRLDKEWSLTDCISFVVMDQYGVTQALTCDRHFRQAGFHVLLA